MITNERTLGFGANINRGVAATTAPLVIASNSDIEVTPGAVDALTRFVEAHPRCGIAAPQLQYPDGRWQPSRRSFPTIRGTLVRRTPLRRLLHPEQRQRDHYLLDEQPSEPALSDWFLGAFLLLRREMLEQLGGLDEGYHLYGEDIDLAYRARKAGWERWYVPERGRRPPPPGPDRPPLLHAPDALALAQHRPVRSQAPREPPRPLAGAWTSSRSRSNRYPGANDTCAPSCRVSAWPNCDGENVGSMCTVTVNGPLGVGSLNKWPRPLCSVDVRVAIAWPVRAPRSGIS